MLIYKPLIKEMEEMSNDSNHEIFEDLLQSGKISSLNIQEPEFAKFDSNAAVAMANTKDQSKKRFGKRSQRKAAAVKAEPKVQIQMAKAEELKPEEPKQPEVKPEETKAAEAKASQASVPPAVPVQAQELVQVQEAAQVQKSDEEAKTVQSVQPSSSNERELEETTEISMTMFQRSEKSMLDDHADTLMGEQNFQIPQEARELFAQMVELPEPGTETTPLTFEDLKKANEAKAAEKAAQAAQNALKEQQAMQSGIEVVEEIIEAEPVSVNGFQGMPSAASYQAFERDMKAVPVSHDDFAEEVIEQQVEEETAQEEWKEEEYDENLFDDPDEDEYEEEEEEDQIYDPDSSLVDDYDYDLYEDKKRFMLSDYKKIESYLSKQSQQGFHYVKHEGKKYYFHKAEPENYYYQILYFAKEPNDVQWDEWKKNGWELVSRAEGKKKRDAGWIVLRNVLLPGSFKETIENEEEKYRFFRKYSNSCRSTMFLLFVCMAVCAIMAYLQWAFKGYLAGIIFTLVLFVISFWVFLVYSRMLSKSKKQCRLLKARIRLAKRRQAKEEEEFEDDSQLDSDWEALDRQK